MEINMQIQQRKKKQITDIGFTIRLDEKLLEKLKEQAKQLDMSINLHINLLLMKGVEEK